MPVVISFTVETDGNLPTGDALKDAIKAVDAATGDGPAYYMINCAHPTHFDSVLEGGRWLERIRGIRANASKCSHEELDEAEELDDGNPVELGRQYAELRDRFPWINVLGGCCGTDHRHIEQISITKLPLATHGRSIHSGHLRTNRATNLSVRTWGHSRRKSKKRTFGRQCRFPGVVRA